MGRKGASCIAVGGFQRGKWREREGQKNGEKRNWREDIVIVKKD